MTTTDGSTRYFMLVAAAIIYGAIFVANKIAAEAGLPPIAYAFWQSFVAGIILLVISLAKRAAPRTDWVAVRAYLVIGALAIGLPMSLLTYVAPNLPAAIVTLVLALSPPMTYAFGVAFRVERMHWLGLLGIAAGFVGVALLILPSAALPAAGMAGWFMLALIAPVLFAASNVAAALLRPPAMQSTAMASGVLLGSSAILAVISAVTGQTYWFPDFPSAGDWALIGAVAINAVFVILYLEIIRIAGPVFFAQFNYLAVLSGIAWGWAVFGDSLHVLVWLAFALMVAGVILTSRRPALQT